MHAKNISFGLSLVFASGAALTVFEASAQPAAPALKYQSAFDGYTRFADEKRANWREINDTVGNLGGHAAHLRDDTRTDTNAAVNARANPDRSAAQVAPVMTPPAAPATKPGRAADPHAGHGKGGAK